MSVHLFDESNGAEAGVLTDAQFHFLQEHLVSEGVEDTDYYINQDTLDAWEREGGDAGVVALLRQALGGRADMDIRWESAE
jgi:hypothetical protein